MNLFNMVVHYKGVGPWTVGVTDNKLANAESTTGARIYVVDDRKAHVKTSSPENKELTAWKMIEIVCSRVLNELSIDAGFFHMVDMSDTKKNWFKFQFNDFLHDTSKTHCR